MVTSGEKDRDRVGGRSGGKVQDGDEQREGERWGGWQNTWKFLEGVATIREIRWVANRVAKYKMATSREKVRDGVGGRTHGKI
jgi:hypothetical protein